MGICNANASIQDMGIKKILAPGKPKDSALYQRILSKDYQNVMPPIHFYKKDKQGIEMIRDWITKLENCNIN